MEAEEAEGLPLDGEGAATAAPPQPQPPLFHAVDSPWGRCAQDEPPPPPLLQQF